MKVWLEYYYNYFIKYVFEKDGTRIKAAICKISNDILFNIKKHNTA